MARIPLAGLNKRLLALSGKIAKAKDMLGAGKISGVAKVKKLLQNAKAPFKREVMKSGDKSYTRPSQFDTGVASLKHQAKEVGSAIGRGFKKHKRKIAGSAVLAGGVVGYHKVRHLRSKENKLTQQDLAKILHNYKSGKLDKYLKPKKKQVQLLSGNKSYLSNKTQS